MVKLHNPLLLDLQSSHLSAIFTSSNTADCSQSVFFIHLRSTNFPMQNIQMSVPPLHWSHEISTPPFIWINTENYSRSPTVWRIRRMKSESYKSGAVMFPSLDNEGWRQGPGRAHVLTLPWCCVWTVYCIDGA